MPSNVRQPGPCFQGGAKQVQAKRLMKYFEDTIQAIRSQETTEMNASLGQDTPVPNDLKLGRTPDEHVTSLHIVLPGTGGFLIASLQLTSPLAGAKSYTFHSVVYIIWAQCP